MSRQGAVLLASTAALLVSVLLAVLAVEHLADDTDPAGGSLLGAESALEDDLALRSGTGEGLEIEPVGWVPAFEFCGRVADGQDVEELHALYLDRYYAVGGGPTLEVWLAQVVPNSCSGL